MKRTVCRVMCAILARVVPLGILAMVCGCATAIPSFAGGSTTPEGRTDLGVGGSARIAFGGLRPSETENTPLAAHRRSVDSAGVVPAGYARYGLRRGYDIGLLASGSLVRLDLRREHVMVEDVTRKVLLFSVAPYAGRLSTTGGDRGSGVRVGFELPLTYSVDFGGVYDLWVGPRLAMEYATGLFGDPGLRVRANAFGLRSGAVIGLAAGMRRVHALLEVTAAWEQWWGDQGGVSLSRGGFVLVPAFAIRIRL